jgi:hypothetical protein
MAGVTPVSHGILGLMYVFELEAIPLPAGRKLGKYVDPVELAATPWALLPAEQEVPQFAKGPDVKFVHKHG